MMLRPSAGRAREPERTFVFLSSLISRNMYAEAAPRPLGARPNVRSESSRRRQVDAQAAAVDATPSLLPAGKRKRQHTEHFYGEAKMGHVFLLK